MNASAVHQKPWAESWMANGLETVAKCPVCGDSERRILHNDLVDRTFHVAPGKWRLWRCAGCESAYLDPRPTPKTIHLAYVDYYTHKPTPKKKDYTSLSPLRKLRRRLVNGYTNQRFGTRAFPASALGRIFLPLLRRQRRRLACEYRHLPKPTTEGGRFLEVGFGSASFLEVAENCGWTVTGVDPDPRVVQAALDQGFDVHRGGIEELDSDNNCFDVIMMNHVIEHVHHPMLVLERAYQLLKTGGVLYIETPNINSLGHKRYGGNWISLDPPRHLVIFNLQSINYALVKCGFKRISWKARENPIKPIVSASVAISRGKRIDEIVAPKYVDWCFVRTASLLQSLVPSSREYITFLARKS